MVNEINEGIVDIVVDREHLKCGYADAAQVEYRRFFICSPMYFLVYINQLPSRHLTMHK